MSESFASYVLGGGEGQDRGSLYSDSGSSNGSSSSRPKRTRAGFFGALASAADDRAKRDEDLDAKAKKAKQLAEAYKKATLKNKEIQIEKISN